MSDKKKIPEIDIPTLEEVVEHGEKKPAPATKAASAKEEPEDRRKKDRRQNNQPLPKGLIDRRRGDRRETDKRRNQELDELVKKIMADMMPDLEQHLHMQLRFELQKHMPRILSEFKDKDE